MALLDVGYSELWACGLGPWAGKKELPRTEFPKGGWLYQDMNGQSHPIPIGAIFGYYM